VEETLLSVKDLKTYFYTKDGVVKAVDGIDFEINKGETLGMVGESGCGKSVSALSIMRLLPMPPAKIIDGKICLKAKNILKISEPAMRKIRGRKISMIFQEPMTSLNPVYTIGEQISEAIRLHQELNKKEAQEKTLAMLKLVEIPEPSRRIKEYPHQMSGGMRQRVMIAMALSCNPELLIADEPTTALDVTIQAQILDLISKLQKEFRTSVLIITHDLGVIAEMADRVMVVYAGKAIESASVREIFRNPRHPYTRGLLKSLPRLDMDREIKLEVIEGMVPDALSFPGGCRFHPRCSFVKKKCRMEEPALVDATDGHQVRCWRHDEI
jgi:peptide/nickel transport system ATP-binding protein/oligopeptide transport system ATP-binding protein